MCVSADRLETLQTVPDVKALRSDQNEAAWSNQPTPYNTEGRKLRGSEAVRGEGRGGEEIRNRDRESQWGRGKISPGNERKVKEKEEGGRAGNLKEDKKLHKEPAQKLNLDKWWIWTFKLFVLNLSAEMENRCCWAFIYESEKKSNDDLKNKCKTATCYHERKLL